LTYYKILLVIPLLLAACTPVTGGIAESQSPGSQTVHVPTQIPSFATSDELDQPVDEMMVSTGESGVGAYTEFQQGSLSIQLFSPQDEAVFNVAQINVSGKAPVGTVISINDQIIVVSESGDFSVPVLLEEGPNVIELVASDLDGNELDIVLAVVYEP
jgi:hypothetical protein